MKTKHIYLFLSLFTIILFACEPETKKEKLDNLIEDADNAKNKSVYTDGEEYNDALVGLDTKINVEVLNLMKLSSVDNIIDNAYSNLNAEDIKEIREQIGLIQKEVASVTEIVQKISCPQDKNNKFKNAALALFSSYNKCYFEDWPLLLNEIEKLHSEEENDVDEAYGRLYDMMMKEQDLVLVVSDAQQTFSKEAGFIISREDHPLDEEFENL
jgi:DNA-binding transcriptional regulator YiaG